VGRAEARQALAIKSYYTVFYVSFYVIQILVTYQEQQSPNHQLPLSNLTSPILYLPNINVLSTLVGSCANYQLMTLPPRTPQHVGRRDRQGQATAFKTPEPVLFLIEMIASEQNQLMAYLAYYGCARINAVTWLRAEDLQGGVLRFRKEHSKTSAVHTLKLAASLKAVLEASQIPASGYLFPARRGNQPKKQYRQRWVDGQRLTEVTGTAVRPVRSTQGFDKALAVTVTRIVSADDPGIDEAIARIPEIAAMGRQAYFGVSSHTFRRSMLQYLFYTLGWEAPKCMAISGHRSLDAFYRYIAYQAHVAQSEFALI
jgi:integrase